MNYNIINEYITFLKREYLEFFKIILKDKYSKKICEEFLNRYIDVRYYNETNYNSEKDFIKRLNKELLDIYKHIDGEEDTLKNIVALFGYLPYFDDLYGETEEGEIINVLIDEECFNIENKKETNISVRKWYSNLKHKKDEFLNTIYTKDFELIENRVARKTYELHMQHHIKISNLYSEFAIEKAYHSGLVAEDALFVKYILTSNLLLNDAINLNFSKYYLLEIEESLFSKEKKFNRLINILNNPLAKRNITIEINYKDYIENKTLIDNLIKEGYSFGIIIDDTFDGNVNILILFFCILVYKDSEFFDMIIEEGKRLNIKVIKL